MRERVSVGRAYVVEASTDLNSWAPMATNVVEYSPYSFSETPIETRERRFCRVRAAAP